MSSATTVTCPVCSRKVSSLAINEHLDTGCSEPGASRATDTVNATPGPSQRTLKAKSDSMAPIFNMRHKRDGSSGQAALPTPSSSAKLGKKRAAQEPPSSQSAGKRNKTTNIQAAAPWAERLRPTSMDEFIGQPHLTGPESLLMTALATGSAGSCILWGPPGCGKTTLARLLAKGTSSVFKELSATGAGINEVRAVVEEARGTLTLTGRKTILFLDEVHRFNKAQQDIFLPFVEQGQIQLIGATTENPSFKLTGALLSRCRVFVLERLTDKDVETIITNAIERLSSPSTGEQIPSSDTVIEEGSSSQPEQLTSPISGTQSSSFSSMSNPRYPSFPQLTPRVISSIVSLSAGDARTAISLLELVTTSPKDINEASLLASLRRSVSTSYDRTGESHYDMISALHKSVRGSQPHAAMYWLARMLTAGEDPLFIARRMVVCASEDIGLADNHALPLAIATYQACQTIGMPECRINLAHLIAYLSEAPKSTRSYEAYNRAEAAAKLDPTAPVPMPVRNAPTGLMKELGYARGYCYNPDYAHPVYNDYLPPQFRDDVYLREQGDMTDKLWDEDALQRWEREANGGQDWENRKNKGTTVEAE